MRMAVRASLLITSVPPTWIFIVNAGQTREVRSEYCIQVIVLLNGAGRSMSTHINLRVLHFFSTRSSAGRYISRYRSTESHSDSPRTAQAMAVPSTVDVPANGLLARSPSGHPYEIHSPRPNSSKMTNDRSVAPARISDVSFNSTMNLFVPTSAE